MFRSFRSRVAVATMLAISLCAMGGGAGLARLPSKIQAVAVDTGKLDNLTDRPVTLFSQSIDLGTDVAWFRVLFKEGHLPSGSSVRVTSLEDGESQILDAETLRQWGNGTALFNGSECRVSPSDKASGTNRRANLNRPVGSFMRRTTHVAQFEI